MIDAVGAASAASDAQRVFYVDTTPLIAPAKHPIVGAALRNAMENILGASNENRDIQSLYWPW